LAVLFCGAGFSCTETSPQRSSRPVTVSPAIVRSEPTELATLPAVIVLSVEPWTFESGEGQVILTPSYRILTTTTKAPLLERVPLFLEMALMNYTSALGPLPRPHAPMETYLMANRSQWSRMTQRLMGDQAEIYLRIQRGGFSSGGRALLFDIGQRDTFAIAAHEGWHQYTQRTFRNPLPVSLEEGLATYMEGFRWDSEKRDRPKFLPWANFERFEQLRTAERGGRLAPLPVLLRSTPQELMAGDPESALVYYAQVWALIHFLNEGAGGDYRGGLRAMLRDAADGRLVPRIQREFGSRAAGTYSRSRTGVDLVALYVGRTSEALDAEYQEFIRQVVKVGGRQRITQGLSPIESE